MNSYVEENETFQPLSIFLHELELACDEERTGRFYLVTVENHAAFLDIENGNISAAKYRLYKGAKAIKLLCKTQWLRFRFDENASITYDKPALPNTSIILHKLENALQEPRTLPTVEEVKKTLTSI